MIHQETEVRFIDSEVGYGVFAKTFISRGTITWVKDQLDREFTAEDLKTFDTAHRELLDRYSYRNARGHYVFCWDHARFMNHSAQPTCLLTPYGLEIAIRDIAPGEELCRYAAVAVELRTVDDGTPECQKALQQDR